MTYTPDETELPLPVSQGGPTRPFGELVDAYQAEHQITRAEVIRRISAVTGNTTKALTSKYHGSGHLIWWGASSARQRRALGQ
jgi:hypothetical protein